jgi:TonB-dependent starch-binding outer membrane protein SusC
MKKKMVSYFSIWEKNKILLIMKLSTILMVLFTMNLSATGFGQFSFTTEGEKIRDVFQIIEKKSNYRFFYNDDFESFNEVVDLNVENQDINQVLDKLLATSDFAYKVFDNNLVVVSLKDYIRKQTNLQQNIVKGTVTDENDDPIPGATIVVKGTTTGVKSDINGNYSINVENAQSILQFSFIGYITEETEVGGLDEVDISLKLDVLRLEEVVVIGYGTVKKSDLTGSVIRVTGEDFKTQSMVQLSEMLTGTVAGFNATQGTSAAGGASMEIRGPKSLSAGSNPLIVLDGVIFNGNLRDINPNDIQSVDILKDASSAAVYGAKAASGVVLITTKKGKTGKPTINFSTKLGVTESNNKRKGLGPEEFIQFRSDYFRQAFPTINYDYYTNPDKLPSSMSTDQWRALGAAPLADNTQEWMSRLQFTSVEKANYVAGKTIDPYDYVFRKGIQQSYDLSISGGTEKATYYWSVGYNNNEGIIVGDQYSSIRSRLNADYTVNDWLNVGLNTVFSDRDESSLPASTTRFYEIDAYGQMFNEDGNLERLPNGQFTTNPLLDYYRTDLLSKTNNLFSNMFVNIKLPFGFNFKVSFQPGYQASKYLSFTTISEKLGGLASEIPFGERKESSSMNWMVDNLLTWKKEIGINSFDLTLLVNSEENKSWSSVMENRNFLPNQNLSYHALQFGDSPTISNYDTRSTGDALMARLNYTLLGRYLLTASVRRDGYSAFGMQNARANFPAIALAWIVSNENFFKVNLIDQLKLRLSWGVNGNRDIGIYSALARMQASAWFDGTSTRVGVNTSSLANYGLRWERTESSNLGLDITLLNNRINFSADAYDVKTTDLLMNRIIPAITGFSDITTNLGELGNQGIEMTLNTVNLSQSKFTWKSNIVFSLNRNKIIKLFGDIDSYTLLGKAQTGEVPDYTNGWFPGQAIDVVWDYKTIGIWQTDEATEAAKYGLSPGDFKILDVNADNIYEDVNDKQFIGHDAPQYRLGLRNDFTFLKNFTASIFVRADLGHIGSFSDAMNLDYGIYDRANKRTGPLPYWTEKNPNYEYPRLNPTSYGVFGGGIMIYKPRSFVRIQDFSLTYNLSSSVTKRLKLKSLQVFGSIRNLATFTKWPGWDPESGMSPMPRTYTFGLNLSL